MPKKPTAEQMQEDAIIITLLEVPEFRAKAGLRPRTESLHPDAPLRLTTGESLRTIARAVGCSVSAVKLWEETALRKLARNPLARRLLAEQRA